MSAVTDFINAYIQAPSPAHAYRQMQLFRVLFPAFLEHIGHKKELCSESDWVALFEFLTMLAQEPVRDAEGEAAGNFNGTFMKQKCRRLVAIDAMACLQDALAKAHRSRHRVLMILQGRVAERVAFSLEQVQHKHVTSLYPLPSRSVSEIGESRESLSVVDRDLAEQEEVARTEQEAELELRNRFHNPHQHQKDHYKHHFNNREGGAAGESADEELSFRDEFNLSRTSSQKRHDKTHHHEFNLEEEDDGSEEDVSFNNNNHNHHHYPNHSSSSQNRHDLPSNHHQHHDEFHFSESAEEQPCYIPTGTGNGTGAGGGGGVIAVNHHEEVINLDEQEDVDFGGGGGGFSFNQNTRAALEARRGNSLMGSLAGSLSGSLAGSLAGSLQPSVANSIANSIANSLNSLEGGESLNSLDKRKHKAKKTAEKNKTAGNLWTPGDTPGERQGAEPVHTQASNNMQTRQVQERKEKKRKEKEQQQQHQEEEKKKKVGLPHQQQGEGGGAEVVVDDDEERAALGAALLRRQKSRALSQKESNAEQTLSEVTTCERESEEMLLKASNNQCLPVTMGMSGSLDLWYFSLDSVPSRLLGSLTEAEFVATETWFSMLPRDPSNPQSSAMVTDALLKGMVGNAVPALTLGPKMIAPRVYYDNTGSGGGILRFECKLLDEWIQYFPRGTGTLVDVLSFLYRDTPRVYIVRRAEGQCVALPPQGAEAWPSDAYCCGQLVVPVQSFPPHATPALQISHLVGDRSSNNNNNNTNPSSSSSSSSSSSRPAALTTPNSKNSLGAFRCPESHVAALSVMTLLRIGVTPSNRKEFLTALRDFFDSVDFADYGYITFAAVQRVMQSMKFKEPDVTAPPAMNSNNQEKKNQQSKEENEQDDDDDQEEDDDETDYTCAFNDCVEKSRKVSKTAESTNKVESFVKMCHVDFTQVFSLGVSFTIMAELSGAASSSSSISRRRSSPTKRSDSSAATASPSATPAFGSTSASRKNNTNTNATTTTASPPRSNSPSSSRGQKTSSVKAVQAQQKLVQQQSKPLSAGALIMPAKRPANAPFNMALQLATNATQALVTQCPEIHRPLAFEHFAAAFCQVAGLDPDVVHPAIVAEVSNTATLRRMKSRQLKHQSDDKFSALVLQYAAQAAAADGAGKKSGGSRRAGGASSTTTTSRRTTTTSRKSGGKNESQAGVSTVQNGPVSFAISADQKARLKKRAELCLSAAVGASFLLLVTNVRAHLRINRKNNKKKKNKNKRRRLASNESQYDDDEEEEEEDYDDDDEDDLDSQAVTTSSVRQLKLKEQLQRSREKAEINRIDVRPLYKFDELFDPTHSMDTILQFLDASGLPLEYFVSHAHAVYRRLPWLLSSKSRVFRDIAYWSSCKRRIYPHQAVSLLQQQKQIEDEAMSYRPTRRKSSSSSAVSATGGVTATNSSSALVTLVSGGGPQHQYPATTSNFGNSTAAVFNPSTAAASATSVSSFSQSQTNFASVSAFINHNQQQVNNASSSSSSSSGGYLLTPTTSMVPATNEEDVGGYADPVTLAFAAGTLNQVQREVVVVRTSIPAGLDVAYRFHFEGYNDSTGHAINTIVCGREGRKGNALVSGVDHVTCDVDSDRTGSISVKNLADGIEKVTARLCPLSNVVLLELHSSSWAVAGFSASLALVSETYGGASTCAVSFEVKPVV